MFPPPQPWKQRISVDPQREYLAFTARFYLTSFCHVPAFLASSFAVMKQANTAPGIVGWAMGADLLKLEFHNLSAWTDAQSLRRFIQEGSHSRALQAHKHDLRRKTTFVYFKVLGQDFPLKWKDAIARQDQQRADEKAALRQ